MTSWGGMRSPAATALLSSSVLFAVGCGSARLGASGSGGLATAVPSEYRVYVANESSDIVSRVVFDAANGARVEREIRVGVMPADTDGPHGVSVSPDGEFLYVTVAHGTPDGWLWKFRTDADTLIARTTLGRFPATMALSADGQLLFIANFNLHGDPVPSDLSLVYSPELRELARIPTCVTPHGSRLNQSGTLHYSACVGSDQVVEVSLSSYQVSSRFSVRPGEEGLLPADNLGASDSSRGRAAADRGGPACSPTWVSPGAGEGADRFVYVSCNAAAQVLEVDVREWRVARRFDTGPGPYNMAVSPDGRRLVVTLRGGQGVAVHDLESGVQRAEMETSQPFTHGVVISPDGRYAFVTNEALGSVRGTLDVFDLTVLERVASVELQHQPGGIDFWRTDPVGGGPAITGTN